MKKQFTLLMLMFMSAFTFAQIVESNKVLVKTLDPQGAQQIIFDFRHKGIDAKTWDHDNMRVQLEIHSNMPEAILTQLVKAGRYNLEGFKEGDFFYITAPNLDKNVTIGGTTLEDEIIVHVEMPKYLQLIGNKLLINKDALVKAPLTINRMDFTLEYKFIYVASEVKTTETTVTSDKTTTTAPKTGSIDANTNTSSNQELQVRFGEILIDGVKFEVE